MENLKRRMNEGLLVIAVLVLYGVVLIVAGLIREHHTAETALREFERIRTTPVAGVTDPIEERWQRSKLLARHLRANASYLEVRLDDWWLSADPDSGYYRSKQDCLGNIFANRDLLDVAREQRICSKANFQPGIFKNRMHIRIPAGRDWAAHDEDVLLFMCMPDLDDKGFAKLWIPLYTRQVTEWVVEEMEHGGVSNVLWKLSGTHPPIRRIGREPLEQVLPIAMRGRFEYQLEPLHDYVANAIKRDHAEGWYDEEDERAIISWATEDWRKLAREAPETKRKLVRWKQDCIEILTGLAQPMDWYDRIE